jgi:hypothetical protein
MWDEIDEEDRLKSGVTFHDSKASFNGLNYYCSESSRELRFLDMRGNVLHTVEVRGSGFRKSVNQCKLAEIADQESLIMLVENQALVKLGFDSKMKWKTPGRFHHDLDVVDENVIFALLRDPVRTHPAFVTRENEIIHDDVVCRLDGEGKCIESVSMADMVENRPRLLEKARRFLTSAKERSAGEAHPRDPFHVNSLEVIRKTIEYPGGPTFNEGDLLFCSRFLDSIGVIDPKAGRVKWHWGLGVVEWPHHASMLPNGNILLFDNGSRRESSRILEMSPANGKIVWQYRAEPPGAFFTRSRGGAQKLPNGNVLITDSEHGRAFEITTEGKTVWEFFNPDLRPDKKARATIYRFMRLSPERVVGLDLPSAVKAAYGAEQETPTASTTAPDLN